jgi:dihydrofolate synthase/folylpolyglutamate synthase
VRVGLVTSPGYRSHRERVRVDGAALTEDEFERLATEVERALERLPAREPGAGYLSPTGAFTIAGLHWLGRQGCDALVVEAGMGGASDESSLTRPSVVAVATIFEEHLGILGGDLAAIAHDKAGAIGPDTHTVVAAPQDPAVRQIIEGAAGRHGAAVELLAEVDDLPGIDKLPTRLMRTNARLGLRAAAAYRGQAIRELPDVRLPGRLSVHRDGGRTWVVDSAISPDGVAAAIGWCRHALGEPSAVLLSIPDSKDLHACIAALGATTPHLVRADVPHMSFTAPDGRSLPTLAEVHDLGDLVLALGTISFVGEVLDHLDIDMTRLF